ncbi:restriction endonuclease subunit S, partial [Vibrio splendidus]
MSDFQHSSDWCEHSFESLIKSVIDYRGRTPLKIGMDWCEGEILALSANNVKQGYIDVDKDAHYGGDELYHKWMTRGHCEKGDIVFTMEAPLGNVAQIPDDKKYILSQRVVLLKVDEKKVSDDFLAYVFRGDNFQRDLVRNSTGSTVSGIQYKKLSRFNIELPAIFQQQKIAKILSTVDKLIEKTQALIDKYTQIKKGMMVDLFTRGIDLSGTPETNLNYGQLRSSYEDSPELYKKTEFGWVPKDWKVSSLDSLAEKITSGSRDWAAHYADEGDLFVRISNLTREHINFRWNSIRYVDIGGGSEGERTRLKEGDILISITADLGIIGVVPVGLGRAFINQHTALVRLESGIANSRYVGNFLQSSSGQKQIEKFNDSGAKAGLNLPTV